MNATGDTLAVRRWPESTRWAGCFVLAVAFHVAGAAALLARWIYNGYWSANAPVITIELAGIAGCPRTDTERNPAGTAAAGSRAGTRARKAA